MYLKCIFDNGRRRYEYKYIITLPSGIAMSGYCEFDFEGCKPGFGRLRVKVLNKVTNYVELPDGMPIYAKELLNV